MNTKEKKQLKERIKNINDKEMYLKIYYILKNDINFKATQNNNGLYFNLNLLDDITLIKIDELLNNDIPPDVKNKLCYNSYYTETYSNKLEKEIYKLKH